MTRKEKDDSNESDYDLDMQREIDALTAEREGLRGALQYIVWQAENMRIWNGTGYTYHPIYAGHIQEAARGALAGLTARP